MKLSFLGTGTSQGIPVIGCTCNACTSTDFRDKRLRSSIAVTSGKTTIVVDSGPDFRQQILKSQIDHLDGVLYTHEHNDHVIGLDDIRPFNFTQKQDIPLYGLKRVLDEVASRFPYVFASNKYPGAPGAKLMRIKPHESFKIGSLNIQALPIKHGPLPILGYKFEELVYITDASFIADDVVENIKNCKVLVINALRPFAHPTHFSLEEAIKMIERIRPESAYITHLSHLMGPTEIWSANLPSFILPAFDGLQVMI